MLKIYIFISTFLIVGIASELTDFLDIEYSGKVDGAVRKITLSCNLKKNVNGKCEDDDYLITAEKYFEVTQFPFK